MKKLFYLFAFSLISCLSEKVEFTEWKALNPAKRQHSGRIDTANYYSSILEIDTIYRSMQGPYRSERIQLSSDDELVYIVGYSSEVLEAKSDTALPPRFMCHNNLNYLEKEKLPWKLKTSGDNSRIFTLSEGQTNLVFPKGFGIPVPANQPFEMVSQVLNHHEKNIDLKAKHKVQLTYSTASKQQPITPLYQQSVFITKQVSGPKGVYGLPLSCVDHIHQSDVSQKENIHDCSITYEDGQHNPYQDQYGRHFTGHWELPLGRQELKTDVTKMLDLSEDTKIHMIGVHLHPFAESLSLWDITLDSLLYEAELKKDTSNFSFQRINYYKDSVGIPVFKEHNYELRSSYHCWDSTAVHTAMAVMYLYLEDN